MSDLPTPDEPTAPDTPSDGATVMPPPPKDTHRGPKAIVMAVVVVAILLVGGVAAAMYSLAAGAPETILDKVPSGTDAVVVVHLDPAASQKMNLFRMTEKFPALGSEDELRQKLNGAMDDALEGSGLTHQDLDWVGGEAGAYVDFGGMNLTSPDVGTPSFAVMLTADDTAGAARTLEKLQESSGTTYTTQEISGVAVSVPADEQEPTTGIVAGVAVIASDADTMRSLIATAQGGASVQGDPEFQTVSAELPQSNLGMLYVNMAEVGRMLDSLGSAGLMTGTEQLQAAQAVGMTVSATGDGLQVDAATTTDPSKLTQGQRDQLAGGDEPNPLLGMVPSDAYAVLASSGVTSGLESSIEQIAQIDPTTARQVERLDLLGPNGLLAHLSGDVGLQVGPGAGLLPVNGTVMVGVDDADATEAWLTAHLPELLKDTPAGGIDWQTEDYNGTTIYSSDPLSGSVPVAWGVTDRALVVGLTAASVERAVDLASGTGETIASSPAYQSVASRLPGTNAVMYIDVQQLLAAVKTFMPAEQYQEFERKGAANVEPITIIAAGSRSDENGSRSTLLIEVP
jgi:hypothetical protein